MLGSGELIHGHKAVLGFRWAYTQFEYVHLNLILISE